MHVAFVSCFARALSHSQPLGVRREHLSLNDVNCEASENATHFILETTFLGCDTTMRKGDSQAIFENSVIVVADWLFVAFASLCLAVEY